MLPVPPWVIEDESGHHERPARGESVASDAVCPECRVGKHGNCDSGAWDWATDSPVACSCWKNDHQ